MTISYNYMYAIGAGFPGVECHSTDDGSNYDSIIWDGGNALPTKAELDSWILSTTQYQMWLLIRGERDRRKLSGGYKVGNYWFHSDDTSRIQQMGLVMMGTNMPNNIMWKTMSNEFVLMTPTLASQIFQSAAASDQLLFETAEQKNRDMMASSDPGSYDYLSGWPLSYGE